jgi:hypothetical protein
LYYREGSPWQFVVRDLARNEELTAPWTSGYTAYLYNSRFPEGDSFKLFQLEGDVEKKEGRIYVYDLKKGVEEKSFSIMASPETIEINRALREQILSGGQNQTQTQTTSSSDMTNVSGKKIVHEYETFEGLLINYDPLPLPWVLNYDEIQGRDVSNYSYKDKISYGHLSGSSLNAIGKVFAEEGNVGLLSMYRRIQGGLDISWFKISVFDNHGNHLQTENIGNTQKDASGVPFRVDFRIEDAADRILIHVRQKNMSQVEQKVMIIDKYNGTIK